MAEELILKDGEVKPKAKKKRGRPKGSKNKVKTYKSVNRIKKELVEETVFEKDDKKFFINVEGKEEELVGQDPSSGKFVAGNNMGKKRKTFTNNEILEKLIDVEAIAVVVNDMIVHGSPDEKKVGLNFIKSIMFKDATKTVDTNITTKTEQVIDAELQDMLNSLTGALNG